MSQDIEHGSGTLTDTGDRVARVRGCELTVADQSWAFAAANAHEIDAHWARRTADNPAFFNGALHLMSEHTIERGVLKAKFLRTDFKSFLYWRDTGTADASVTDAFGSALVRSAEGHVLLGKQRPGHVNGGLAYLPGGFIDAKDVAADGTIDIEASIARELREETGLEPATFVRSPGLILTYAGPMLSIAAEFRSSLPAAAIRALILDHIAGEAEPELVDVVVVRSRADLEGLDTPAYARVLLGALFSD